MWQFIKITRIYKSIAFPRIYHHARIVQVLSTTLSRSKIKTYVRILSVQLLENSHDPIKTYLYDYYNNIRTTLADVGEFINLSIIRCVYVRCVCACVCLWTRKNTFIFKNSND